ncbi:MAG: hypothetical protein ACTSX8_05255, partial [Alphaproteobacteria bacterium]
ARKKFFRGYSPAGAVLAVQRLAGAGETNPRKYSHDERQRRLVRGPKTGGAAQGSRVHHEVERFVEALWAGRATGRPAPKVETAAAATMLRILHGSNFTPLAAEMPVGGVEPRMKKRWGTRIDMVCMCAPVVGRAPRLAFIELKSGRQNEIYEYQPSDPPVDFADRFVNAYKNPSDRDQLQACAAAAFAHLPYKSEKSFFVEMQLVFPGAQLQHFLLRVSTDERFGRVHEPWLRAMHAAVLGQATAERRRTLGAAAAAAAAEAVSKPARDIIDISDDAEDMDNDDDLSREFGGDWEDEL